MAENQNQSPGAEEQQPGNILSEPSIGMVYDKKNDQAGVISQKPDGTFNTVDPTPENENLFFIMDKNIPANFYKNLQKYHNNPNINIYVFPRRALGRMKEALEKYWKRPKTDDVRLLYNYKMRPDGQFVCKLKTHGIRDNQIPWDTLAQFGLNYGMLEKSGNLKRLQNYEPSTMMKINYSDGSIASMVGDAKLHLRGKGDNVKVDLRFRTNNPDKKIDGVDFTEEDMQNLRTFGNLGRVFETPKNRYFVSQDFDTQQIERIPVDKAYFPEQIYRTKLQEPTLEALKRGEAVSVTIVDKNGNAHEGIFQYNALYGKPMPQMTVEQRNALANKQRHAQDIERIISQPTQEKQQSPQAKAPTDRQDPAQAQAPVTTEPQQAPAQTQTQTPPQVPTQTQAPRQGQGQARDRGPKTTPRPQVKTPAPKAGQKNSKHL